MSGSWKVAYSDFMTAMMAFFLLMWILNMTTPEAKVVIAGYFDQSSPYYAGVKVSGIASSAANNPLVQYVDRAKLRNFKLSEAEESDYAVGTEIKNYIMKNPMISKMSGITSDGIGVLLHVESDLMFEPNSVRFSSGGEAVLDNVADIMRKYKTFLVVRGHTDSSETGKPEFSSRWDLASARANSAVRYLIGKGANPAMLRSITYADTRPKVISSGPEARKQNSRVEIYFHRSEVMPNVVGY